MTTSTTPRPTPQPATSPPPPAAWELHYLMIRAGDLFLDSAAMAREVPRTIADAQLLASPTLWAALEDQRAALRHRLNGELAAAALGYSKASPAAATLAQTKEQIAAAEADISKCQQQAGAALARSRQLLLAGSDPAPAEVECQRQTERARLIRDNRLPFLVERRKQAAEQVTAGFKQALEARRAELAAEAQVELQRRRQALEAALNEHLAACYLAELAAAYMSEDPALLESKWNMRQSAVEFAAARVPPIN